MNDVGVGPAHCLRALLGVIGSSAFRLNSKRSQQCRKPTTGVFPQEEGKTFKNT